MSAHDGSMKDKVVIVTGGSQGVGLGIRRALLRADTRVVSCARKPFDGCPAAETWGEGRIGGT